MSADTRRLGAMAALLALLRCEDIAKKFADDPEDETAELIRTAQAKGVQAIIDGAGDMPPFVAGFVAALAEYIYGERATDGHFDLLVWKPETAMSEVELTTERQKFEAYYAGGEIA